jgi:hypothetical protein
MTFAALYAVAVGGLMLAQWTFFLVRGQVPELQTEPLRIWFHLVAEFVTAIALIAGGLGLLLAAGWGRPLYLVAMGMLLYTVIVSPGYYAQRGEWPFVAMFAAVLLLALVSLVLVW